MICTWTKTWTATALAESLFGFPVSAPPPHPLFLGLSWTRQSSIRTPTDRLKPFPYIKFSFGLSQVDLRENEVLLQLLNLLLETVQFILLVLERIIVSNLLCYYQYLLTLTNFFSNFWINSWISTSDCGGLRNLWEIWKPELMGGKGFQVNF